VEQGDEPRSLRPCAFADPLSARLRRVGKGSLVVGVWVGSPSWRIGGSLQNHVGPARTARLLAVVAILSASAFAANVVITASGTYNSTAPTNAYTAPNAPWTLSFQVGSTPTVNSNDSTEFGTVFTIGVFTLNGVSVPVTGSRVVFFSSNTSFDIFLDSAANTQFIVSGPPLFSGTTSSPTMLSGSFTPTLVESMTNTSVFGGFFYGFSTGNSNVVVSPLVMPATPAPTSVILVSLGLVGLALLESMRRRQPNGK
jgi:hypothetical protein